MEALRLCCQESVDIPSDTWWVRHTCGMAVTKLRNLRVDDDLWAEAQRIAADRRETLSAVMKRALVEYVEQHGGDVTRPD